MTYTYDTPGTYSLGRLTGITRHGGTVVYEYDRFGRMTKDGDLTYGYDLNGNRTTVSYPGGLTAAYTHDHADRQVSLSVTEGGNPPFAVVSSATYKPFGPLSSVLLGNGALETRTFDARYQPAAIQASTAQSLLDWSYTLDPVGNITSIQDVLTPPNSRTYGYRDIFYYLTQGDGPWGPRSWTYDRIGNRLTEVRGAVADTYTYQVNAGGGNNPKLLSVAQGGGGGTRIFRYDAAGNTVLNMDDEQKVNLIPDGEGRMAFLRTLPEETITSFRYDGRSYLREAAEDYMGCSSRKTVSIYSSDGLLHRREHRLMADNTVLDGDSILYFAGRPVAVVNQGGPLATLTYLTTDHLGTPVLATDESGGVLWSGGFEPFGADWNGADGAGVFLRFPGQWVDGTWKRDRLVYNVYRWYSVDEGQYTAADPVGLGAGALGALNLLYAYADAAPTSYFDRQGLLATRHCSPEQVKALERAVTRAKEALRDKERCKLCDSDRSLMAESLDSSTYYCVDNDEFTRGFYRFPDGACGTTNNDRGNRDGRSISILTPDAFEKTGNGPGECGCLEGLIFHEATHNALGACDRCDTNNAYDTTSSCLPCAVSRANFSR